jgi:hypothetical protein
VHQGLQQLGGVLADAPCQEQVIEHQQVRSHLVGRQCGVAYGVELGLLQVGLEQTFREAFEHHVAARVAVVRLSLLMQLGPDLLARIPDHAAEAEARIPPRVHEQAGRLTQGGRHEVGASSYVGGQG